MTIEASLTASQHDRAFRRWQGITHGALRCQFLLSLGVLYRHIAKFGPPSVERGVTEAVLPEHRPPPASEIR